MNVFRYHWRSVLAVAGCWAVCGYFWWAGAASGQSPTGGLTSVPLATNLSGSIRLTGDGPSGIIPLGTTLTFSKSVSCEPGWELVLRIDMKAACAWVVKEAIR